MKRCQRINKALREPLRGHYLRKVNEGLCRWCKKIIFEKKKRAFCSDECHQEHLMRSNISYLRQCVFKRDNGICSICKTDCEELKLKCESILAQEGKYQLLVFLKKLDFPTGRIKGFINRNQSFWDADHIVPVKDGGGGCGLEGMRTLCAACHYKITRSQKNNYYENNNNQILLW